MQTPKVTAADVEQIVRREFPAEQFESVMALLDQVKREPEEARIDCQLFILKTSFGKLEQLRRLIPTAPEKVSVGGTVFVKMPVPQVARKHVERIVRRDFPAEKFPEVMAALNEYGKESYEREIDRVRLDILKFANGKMDVLQQAIKIAKADYRDVISMSEYPSYRFDTLNLPAEEQRQIHSKDWRQYLAWANAK